MQIWLHNLLPLISVHNSLTPPEYPLPVWAQTALYIYSEKQIYPPEFPVLLCMSVSECLDLEKKKSFPSKVHSSHLVEPQIVRVVKIPEVVNDLRFNMHMCPAFGFAQAMWLSAALRLFQTGEALGLVEVEMFVCDNALQAQEVLHTTQLESRVADEPLAIDKVDLRQWEISQPALQVLGVQADVEWTPQRVHLTWWSVLKSQAFKAGNARRLGGDLSVVGDGAGHGITHHHDQLHVSWHGVDTSWRLGCHKVPWRFLHHYLAVQRFGHHAPEEQTETEL